MISSICLVASVMAAVTSAQQLVAAPEHPGWVKTGAPSATESLKLTVSVQKQNLDELFAFVADVSDPDSPQYKSYKTMEEVNAMTAPNAADVDAVVAWLVSVGADTKVNNGVVSVDMTVTQAEQLFKTKFHTMVEVSSGRTATKASDYIVPAEVSSAVGAIFGLHGLPLPKSSANKLQAPGMPPIVTPKVLNEAYGIAGVTPAGDTKNRMAVAEFQGQYMNTSDLKVFFDTYLPDAPAADAEVYKFHGQTPEGEGIEAQLDIQFIMGVAPGIKAEFYEQANMDFCSDLKNWTSLLLSTDDVPWVHSVSYGWQGNLTQIGCKPDEVTDVDADFAKLAARGVSIIFASGDSGSGYAPPQPPMPPPCSHTEPGSDGTKYTGDVLRVLEVGIPPSEPLEEAAWICCTIAGEIGEQEHYAGWTFTKNTKCNGPSHMCTGNCTILKTITTTEKMDGYVSGKAKKAPAPPPGPKKSPLWPSWPASSPFVTAVGATRFNNDTVGGEQAAVGEEDHFGSGGGFSPWAFLKQGKWQAAAVEKYFKVVDPSTLPGPAASYNKNGRATPDVSALGTGYGVINGGKPLPGGVGGTSASAPVFAGMISLINDALIQNGQKPLGLLNPFIYKNEMAFTDITIGSDKIGRGGGMLPYGFNCAKGWDPVTGVGTPMFKDVLKAAMKAEV